MSVDTSVLRWTGWATVTYGRVGKLETRVGKRKFFLALCAEFYQTNVCPPWRETVPVPLYSMQDVAVFLGLVRTVWPVRCFVTPPVPLLMNERLSVKETM